MTRSHRIRVLLGVAGIVTAAAAHGVIIPVTTTADSGLGSLRQAIQDSNTSAGTPDTITFNIPGAGVHVIQPTSPLPSITDPVVIDGYSQPGAHANTLAVGDDAVILIEIDGTNAGTVVALLLVQTGGATITGLSIVHSVGGDGISFEIGSGGLAVGNFVSLLPDGVASAGNGCAGIRVGIPNVTVGGSAPADRNVISGTVGCGINLLLSSTNGVAKGNYIGTNAAGMASVGGAVGVDLTGGGHQIGGTAAGEGNLISGVNGDGIRIRTGGTGMVIAGNLIGTNRTGMAALPNLSHGVFVFGGGADNNQIGIPAQGGGNVISGNNVGVEIDSNCSNNLVQANRIGTNALGTDVVPNLTGVRVGGPNTIGGPVGSGNLISGNSQNGIEAFGGGPILIAGNFVGYTHPNGASGILATADSNGTIGGPGNTIAFNTGSGIALLGVTNFSILGNSIHDNGALGIDLNGDGPSPNDPGDPDGGPNGLQNYPVLTSAAVSPASIRIQGTLNSTANTAFRVDFFSSPSCDGSGYGEGATFLGFTNVMTDGTGNGPIDATLPVQVAAGAVITATAIGPSGTSEFSLCLTSVPAGLRYYPLPPCRVADTRNPNGPLGGPALAANAERTFVVTGVCGVPSSALAVSFNIAVTLESAFGDLRIFPAGTPLPLVSAINYRPFKTRSDDAVIGLGAAGDVTVHVDQPSGTVHLILDVDGYFQ